MNAFLHVDDSEHWIKTFIALGLVSNDWKTSGRRSMGSTAVMSLSRGSFPEAADPIFGASLPKVTESLLKRPKTRLAYLSFA